jgi:hypothetical protein
LRALERIADQRFCSAWLWLAFSYGQVLAAALGIRARHDPYPAVDNASALGAGDLHYLRPNILSNLPVAPMLLPYAFLRTWRVANASSPREAALALLLSRAARYSWLVKLRRVVHTEDRTKAAIDGLRSNRLLEICQPPQTEGFVGVAPVVLGALLIEESYGWWK